MAGACSCFGVQGGAVTFQFRKRPDTPQFDWYEVSVLSHPGAKAADDMGRSVGVYGDYAVVGASTKGLRMVAMTPRVDDGVMIALKCP